MNDREDFRKSFKENNRDQKSCSPVRSKLQLLTLVKYIYIYIYICSNYNMFSPSVWILRKRRKIEEKHLSLQRIN
jgi:hypothetical protein